MNSVGLRLQWLIGRRKALKETIPTAVPGSPNERCLVAALKFIEQAIERLKREAQKEVGTL